MSCNVFGSGKPARNQQIKSITSDCRQLRRFCVVSYDAFLASYPNQGPYFVRSSLRNACCRTFEINLSIHEKPVDPIKENWLIRCTFVGTRENCTLLVIGSWEKERVFVCVREWKCAWLRKRVRVFDWKKSGRRIVCEWVGKIERVLQRKREWISKCFKEIWTPEARQTA